jgi:hypothetical protein
MRALFLAQLVSTYGMVAVILFVQLVHGLLVRSPYGDAHEPSGRST